MKTKPWNPPPATAAAPMAAPVSPLQIFSTPIYLVSDATQGQAQEYEVVSACYQAWVHLRDRIPFKLSLKDGFVLASFQNGQLVVDDAFKTAFVVFDNVMSLEVKQAVTNTMNMINAEIAKRDAHQRMLDEQQAQAAAEAPTVEPQPTQESVTDDPPPTDKFVRKSISLETEALESESEVPSESPATETPSASPTTSEAVKDSPKVSGSSSKARAADVLSALTATPTRRRR